jgi:hypothetical protein
VIPLGFRVRGDHVSKGQLQAHLSGMHPIRGSKGGSHGEELTLATSSSFRVVWKLGDHVFEAPDVQDTFLAIITHSFVAGDVFMRPLLSHTTARVVPGNLRVVHKNVTLTQDVPGHREGVRVKYHQHLRPWVDATRKIRLRERVGVPGILVVMATRSGRSPVVGKCSPGHCRVGVSNH